MMRLRPSADLRTVVKVSTEMHEEHKALKPFSLPESYFLRLQG